VETLLVCYGECLCFFVNAVFKQLNHFIYCGS
jgi:hypothetical protein